MARLSLQFFPAKKNRKTIHWIWVPSGYVNSQLLKMAIDIVEFPINSMVIFNSYVTNYQRVNYHISLP